MNRITLRPCMPDDANLISVIAHKTWWSTYGPFLSKEQISFMLNEMYEPTLISKNIEQGISFLLAEIDNQAVGFISFCPKENSSAVFRIEKLYVLEEVQGLGVGMALVNQVVTVAKELGFYTLELNVNRNNGAISFYKKQGFKVIKEIDIPYYQFVLNDYVMQIDLSSTT